MSVGRPPDTSVTLVKPDLHFKLGFSSPIPTVSLF